MKTPHIILIAIVVLLIVLYFSKNKIKAALTRGYRNNNPGNITNDGIQWVGQKAVSTDPPFKQFVSMPYGYRALWVNSRGAINGGFNTIQKMITRYAPPSENNTAAYIDFVSKKLGISPTTVLSFNDTPTMRKLVAAISQQENGLAPNMDDVDQGYKLLTV